MPSPYRITYIKDLDLSNVPGLTKQQIKPALWALHIINFKWHTDPRARERGFVKLMACLLGKMMAGKSNVRPVMDALENAGIIECDGRYGVGRESYGYRIAQRYRGEGIWGWMTPPGQVFNNQFERYIEDARAVTPQTKNPLTLDHMRRFVCEAEFGPTLDEAILSISDEPYPDDGKIRDWPSPRACAIYRASLFDEKNHRFLIRDRHGRAQTSCTSLNRELRPSLILRGQPLVTVDVSCAQPFILAMLTLAQLLPSSLVLTSNLVHPTTKGLYDSRIIPEDLKRMIRLVTQGRFYQVFRNIPQGEIKEKLFVVYFARIDAMVNSSIGKEFKRIFPTPFDFIVRTKRDNPWSNDPDLAHTWLAHLLQEAESSVMIDFVADSLRVNHPTVPFLTIHDAIMVPPTHVDLAKGLIQEGFRRAYGHVPHLKVEPPRLKKDGPVIVPPPYKPVEAIEGRRRYEPDPRKLKNALR